MIKDGCSEIPDRTDCWETHSDAAHLETENVFTKQGDLEPGRPSLSEQSGAAHDSHKGHMLSQTPSTELDHGLPSKFQQVYPVERGKETNIVQNLATCQPLSVVTALYSFFNAKFANSLISSH
jgi:hypothetical protein